MTIRIVDNLSPEDPEKFKPEADTASEVDYSTVDLVDLMFMSATDPRAAEEFVRRSMEPSNSGEEDAKS